MYHKLFEKKKNVAVSMPIGQLLFGCAGTVEFKSASPKEMELPGPKSALGSVAESGGRASSKHRSWAQNRAETAVNSRRRVFGSRTAFRNNKLMQANGRGPREAGGEMGEEAEAYSYLSDFLRSQIGGQRVANETNSTDFV